MLLSIIKAEPSTMKHSRTHEPSLTLKEQKKKKKIRQALGYLYKHTRALTSCFLLPGERSHKQSDSGDASALLLGPQGHVKAGCCILEKWHNEPHQRGDACPSCTAAIWDGCVYDTVMTHQSLTLTYKCRLKNNS